MSPVSKSESGRVPSLHRQSKSHDKQSSMDSPSSRHSYGGGNGKNSGASGSKGHHHQKRRRSSPTAIKSSLRETLSSFGDDVIRIKKYPGNHAYDNHGYFQPDISFDTNNSGAKGLGGKDDESPYPIEKESMENELAVIMSHHDPSFQTKHFERVKPSEVGVRPSKWQQLLQTSVSSSRFQKLARQKRKDRGNDDGWSAEDNFLEDLYNSNGSIEYKPPFWGVSRRTRGNFSFLTLSLILHELACFTSCVLLGCMLFEGMEAISWVKQKPHTENWLLFKGYSSFQTILVVITCIGFLNRVDTTDHKSLWLLPLFLVPVLGLSISDYCNKAWELQRLECFNYFRLDELAKQKFHLSQDCSSLVVAFVSSSKQSGNPASSAAFNKMLESPVTSMTELSSRGLAPLVMRILAMLSILVIALYLFCCRKNNFLIDLFGPPQEFRGNLELINDSSRRTKANFGKERSIDDEGGEDVNVIFRRNGVNRD